MSLSRLVHLPICTLCLYPSSHIRHFLQCHYTKSAPSIQLAVLRRHFGLGRKQSRLGHNFVPQNAWLTFLSTTVALCFTSSVIDWNWIRDKTGFAMPLLTDEEVTSPNTPNLSFQVKI